MNGSQMTLLDAVFAGAQRIPEPTASPTLSFDLPEELQTLRTEDHPWQAGRNAKILVKYAHLRVLFIGLRAGAHLAEHRAAGPVTIQVISGRVRTRAGGKVLELREGQLFALEAEVPHNLEALDESAVLVTIAWPGD